MINGIGIWLVNATRRWHNEHRCAILTPFGGQKGVMVGDTVRFVSACESSCSIGWLKLLIVDIVGAVATTTITSTSTISISIIIIIILFDTRQISTTVLSFWLCAKYSQEREHPEDLAAVFKAFFQSTWPLTQVSCRIARRAEYQSGKVNVGAEVSDTEACSWQRCLRLFRYRNSNLELP